MTLTVGGNRLDLCLCPYLDDYDCFCWTLDVLDANVRAFDPDRRDDWTWPHPLPC